MPRSCTVCTHKERNRIDKLILDSESYRNIAKRFSLSSTSVYRHKSHLNETVIKSKELKEIAHADNLLEQVRELQSRALNILSKTEEAEDWKAATGAIREARGCLELLAKLAGELRDGQTVNLIVSPQWIEFRTVILRALVPYPKASNSVQKAMEKLTNESTSS